MRLVSLIAVSIAMFASAGAAQDSGRVTPMTPDIATYDPVRAVAGFVRAAQKLAAF